MNVERSRPRLRVLRPLFGWAQSQKAKKARLARRALNIQALNFQPMNN
jgi:hypothetical protein